MNRTQRLRAIASVIGVSLILYLRYLGVLRKTYIGLILGFTAGFLLDASVREKSLFDNTAMGLFLAGVLAVSDFYTSLTDLTAEKLGDGFVLAVCILALLTLLGAMFDEIKVGRTVRVSYVPTALIILSVLILYSAVSVNTKVSYVRTSHGPDNVYDVVRRYNSTYASNFDVTPTPVINGTKAFTSTAPIDNATLAYLKLFVYTVKNTTRTRHAGNLTMTITLTPAPAELPRDEGDLALRCLDSSLQVIHKILPVEVNYDNTTGVTNATFTLSSLDVYYANIAYAVIIYIDVHYLPTTSITATIDMKIVGERVLNTDYAYLALGLVALASLMAIPETVTSRARAFRRRR